MISTRVIVISDLHLGGSSPVMMSHPELLEEFLRQLSPKGGGDTLELVIAGDFVDFLAIPLIAAWTPEPKAACTKLETAMQKSQFAPIFKALKVFLGNGHRLTIMLGNHDVEMGLPPVQEAFLREIEASQRQHTRQLKLRIDSASC